MAWSTPRTWFAGETVTVNFMNAQIRDNFNLIQTLIDSTTGLIKAASSSYFEGSLAGLVQILNMQTPTSSNTNSGTGETTAITYTMPAGQLATNGGGIRISSWGTTTNSANAKIVRVYFGATAMEGFSGMMANSVAHNWLVEAVVIRLSATTQVGYTNFVSGATAAQASNDSSTTPSPAETLANAIVIKTTLQGGASSELTALGQMVEVIQQ